MNTARELMQLHGLQGWNFKFDHARRRAGQCDFTNQTISLSRHYARLANDEHIRDTILHEIAHALVGPSHGHNNIWRSMAMKLGVQR